LQKFKEVKHKLLKANEWKASMGENYPEKKRYRKNTKKL
jgi:hypothetical protein